MIAAGGDQGVGAERRILDVGHEMSEGIGRILVGAQNIELIDLARFGVTSHPVGHGHWLWYVMGWHYIRRVIRHGQDTDKERLFRLFEQRLSQSVGIFVGQPPVCNFLGRLRIHLQQGILVI